MPSSTSKNSKLAFNFISDQDNYQFVSRNIIDYYLIAMLAYFLWEVAGYYNAIQFILYILSLILICMIWWWYNFLVTQCCYLWCITRILHLTPSYSRLIQVMRIATDWIGLLANTHSECMVQVNATFSWE